METHPRGYLYPRGCRPRYPQHISGLSEPSGTITLLSRLLARGYSTCGAVGKAKFLELPHSSHIHSIFSQQRTLCSIHVIFTATGRPCTGHTFSAGVTSLHPFLTFHGLRDDPGLVLCSAVQLASHPFHFHFIFLHPRCATVC